MNDTIAALPLEHLHESPFNPRKIFDDASLAELAADIKAQGRVLQPLLVRPRVPPLFSGDPDAATGHEIVFGHRRFRAAELAGLASVPCMVRAMTDEEARHAQISENLQRKDVHPIEEAEGFQALIDNDNQSADSIAEQFGKSRSYVYGRLKLLEACPTIRAACLKGEIGSEVALLVARLRTPKLQEKALGYIYADYRAKLDDGGKASYRAIRSMLAEKFTLDLKTAMFDVEDEMLLPIAGNCIRCTKRSANAPEYADLVENSESRHGNPIRGNANACTDPDCFDAKKKAHLKREAAKLAAEGKVVIDGNAARSAISASGEIKGAYVALKDVQAELKKLPRKGAEGQDNQPQVVLIQDPRTGKTHKAVKREDVKAAGVKAPAARQNDHANYQAQQARANEERARNLADAKAATEANVALLDRTLAAMAGQPRTTEELHWMAERVFDGTDWDVRGLLAKRHGFSKPDELEKVLGQWPADRLALFAVECVLLGDAFVEPHALYGGKKAPAPELINRCAAHYGVELPTPSTAARAPAEAKAAPAGAKGNAKAKNKGNGKKDDAGVAGGSGAQVDVFEEAGA